MRERRRSSKRFSLTPARSDAAGSIADGTTVTDHEPEDAAHLQSTTVGFAHAAADGIEMTLVDRPGFVDFFEETRQALAGVDAAVIVVEADPSRIVQTQAIVDHLEAVKMPHVFVINKMDRPGADFAQTLAALQAAYGRHVVAEQLAIGNAEQFEGYVDLAEMKAYRFDGGAENECALPDDLSERAQQLHGEMLEAMADFDDHLMEELLEGIEPPLDEIERDLCEECSHDQIIPVLVASGISGVGVAALVRAMEKWFPSPAAAPHLDAEGRPIEPDPAGPVVARVIKTSIHPQSGKVSIARILSGTLKADATLANLSKRDEKVRLGGLYRLQGKKQEPLPDAGPGSIVALGRLETVGTGDTLASTGHKVLLPRVPVADPVFAVAIKPKDRIDEAKISQMLARIVDEDPALRLDRADVTHEMLLLGRGEQHVSIAVERLARKYKVEVETAPPTIPVLGDDHGRHRGPLPLQAPDRRARTVRRRLAALRTARARIRRHVRRQDRGRRRSSAVHSRSRKRRTRGARPRRQRLSGDRSARDALRRRSTTTLTPASSRSRPRPAWECAKRSRNATPPFSSRSRT